MTSSALRERSARPCSPSAQRSASARLLLPEPFGPTTALIPPPNSTFVRSANDLKPWSRSASRRGAAGRASAIGALASCRSSPTAARASVGRALAPGCARSPRAAAAVSATRRDGPSPTPSTSPSTQTSTRNDFSWSGPDRLDDPVVGPLAGSALGVLLQPALRALEREDRRLQRSAPARPAPISQSRDGVVAEVEVERAGERLERRRRAATAGAGRCAATRPRRAAGTGPRSMRPARRARPVVETIAARRADSAPSSSSGWRA